MASTYPALAIGNYFIKKNLSLEEKDHSLSIMKLQKLIYIAHGSWLASRLQPLINESIEAWRFGPVIRSVYDEYKGKGLEMLDKLARNPFTKKNYEIEEAEVRDFLEKVRESTFKISGIQLSNWSHEEGGPWDQVYNHTKNGDTGYAAIDNLLIKEYFEKQAGISS